MKPKRRFGPFWSIPITAVDVVRRFPKVVCAARKLGIGENTIGAAIVSGKPACGYHFIPAAVAERRVKEAAHA